MEHWRSHEDRTRSSKNKDLGAPTWQNTAIENKAEKPALPNAKTPSNLGGFMKPDHRRMSRMLACALVFADVDGWTAFTQASTAFLTASERRELSLAALKAIPPADQIALLSHFLNAEVAA